MSELIVLAYKGEDTANQALEELDRLQKLELIQLEDAAVVVKNQKGKVKVKQTLEKKYTGASAVWGGFWGLLIGLLFLNPLLWGLIGAAMGALFSKGADLGIDNKFMKEVGDSMEPGDSALFMLVVKATKDKVIPELQKYGGTVYQTSLSNEDEAKLKQALSKDEVKAVAEDSLELETS
ncbi:MAG: DUF1269 domain-containing protein [Chloroflexi bacterium]|nr:DUF1269 domain-containing protein [Chloroflexota bacterium]